MAYTEYKFAPDWVKQETEKTVASLKQNTGRTDFVKHACEIIRSRLQADNQSYLAYGPYWWALKEILTANGFVIGSTTDKEISQEYRGNSDEETIVAAEKFREDYYSKFFAGNNEFMLDAEDKNPWVLQDSDCETLKYRGKFADLGLSETEQREWEKMAAFFGNDFLSK